MKFASPHNNFAVPLKALWGSSLQRGDSGIQTGSILVSLVGVVRRPGRCGGTFSCLSLSITRNLLVMYFPPHCNRCWEVCLVCVQWKRNITLGKHEGLLQWGGYVLCQSSFAGAIIPQNPLSHRSTGSFWTQEILSQDAVDGSEAGAPKFWKSR